MGCFLGIDGGGTTTSAVITDGHGKIHGIGKSGNGNDQINLKTAEVNIIAAVRKAIQNARIRVDEIEYAWFGFT